MEHGWLTGNGVTFILLINEARKNALGVMDPAKKKESTACVYASRQELQIEPGINRFIIWDVQYRGVSG